jgi:DNA-directed RNA polymerase subunit K/omega
MSDQPERISNFEFVILSALRAEQLMAGCTPRVPAAGKATTTARREVADGKVISLPRVAAIAGRI